MRIHGLILAGGEGRRMGGVDKALVTLGGQTLLARINARLEPQVAELALSANGDPQRFLPFAHPILSDATDERCGPMAGILAGLQWLSERGGDALVTVSVDTPFIPLDIVARLKEAASATRGCAVARSHGRLHPTCGFWPVSVRTGLREALASGERRLGRWAAEQGVIPVDFVGEPDPFFNLNTPQDMEHAEGWVAP